MLILTCRPGESIVIDSPVGNATDGGEYVTVTVLGVKGNQVRIGRAVRIMPKALAALAGQALEKILAWLDRECGITQDFGVAEGRSFLRCRDITR